MIIKQQPDGRYWVLKSSRSKTGFPFDTMHEAAVKRQTLIIENAIEKLREITVNDPEACYEAGRACLGMVDHCDSHYEIEHRTDPGGWRC